MVQADQSRSTSYSLPGLRTVLAAADRCVVAASAVDAVVAHLGLSAVGVDGAVVCMAGEQLRLLG